MPLKQQGNRSENRGHWTAGKRRNDPGPHWPATLAELLDRLQRFERGVCSRRVLAAKIGVDVKTVCRWLSGVDLPDHASVMAIRAWLRSLR